jgi:hypothetical protein
MATPRTRRPRRSTSRPADPVSRLGVIVLGLILLIMAVTLLYLLIGLWPPPSGQTTLATNPPVTLDSERSYLLLVALAGATGAIVHVLRSFFAYAGERKLVWSWVPSYFLIPVVGALLGTLVYIVVRAGLIPGGTDQANPFGFAAIAGLVGLFSGQAAAKLKDVFETLFAAPEKHSDHLDEDADDEEAEAEEGTVTRPQPVAVSITSFTPTLGSVGETVVVAGTGLADVTSVTFGGGVASDAAFNAVTGELTTTVPVGAVSGRLSVRNGTRTATSGEAFVIPTLAPTTTTTTADPLDGTITVAAGPAAEEDVAG